MHRISFLFLAMGLSLPGCALVKSAGMKALYREAPLPENRIIRDISYVAGSPSPRHRLNLFLPGGRDWPILIFVHGGGWTEGDKDYRFAGKDLYGNIGRFFASRGVGVAVVNYRLQPATPWRGQVEDVARATAWVARHAKEYGGDPGRIFLCGHSAGAHLAAFAATDLGPRMPPLMPKPAGVIAVSGAGYDLSDAETYRLGQKVSYYAGVFNPDGKDPVWQKNASPAGNITAESPPFLLLVAEGDEASMRRQTFRFHEILDSRGVRNELVIIPGESHTRIVLTLSRRDKIAADAILRFVGSPPPESGTPSNRSSS